MTKKLRSILSVVLAMAMIFAMATTAFAAETANVTLKLTVDDITAQEVSVAIPVGGTAEDAINAAADKGIVSAWSGSWLKSLTFGGVTYASAPYVADAACFDEDGFYVGGDPVLDAITEHEGVMMDASMLAPGYYFMNDNYTMYIGSDWAFTVDYISDGIGNPVVPGEPDESYPDKFRQYTLGETVLSEGDIVCLDYAFVPTFFLM